GWTIGIRRERELASASSSVGPSTCGVPLSVPAGLGPVSAGLEPVPAAFASVAAASGSAPIALESVPTAFGSDSAALEAASEALVASSADSEAGGIIGFVFALRLRGLRSFGPRSGQASLGRGPTFGQLFLIGDDRDRTGGQVTVE